MSIMLRGGSVRAEGWPNAHDWHEGEDLRLTITNGSVGFRTDKVEVDLCRDDLVKLHRLIARLIEVEQREPDDATRGA